MSDDVLLLLQRCPRQPCVRLSAHHNCSFLCPVHTHAAPGSLADPDACQLSPVMWQKSGFPDSTVVFGDSWGLEYSGCSLAAMLSSGQD